MTDRHRVPPGWPRSVPTPGPSDWAERAGLWLLDLSPAEYRSYSLLRRYPLLLAWLAERNVSAQLDAARQAYARARAEIGGAGRTGGVHRAAEHPRAGGRAPARGAAGDRPGLERPPRRAVCSKAVRRRRVGATHWPGGSRLLR